MLQIISIIVVVIVVAIIVVKILKAIGSSDGLIARTFDFIVKLITILVGGAAAGFATSMVATPFVGIPVGNISILILGKLFWRR